MKKILLIILGTCAAVVLLIALAGMYKFNYLASQPGYNVDGNKITEEYTFEIIETLNQSCQVDTECETPPEYAIQSNCPYDSLCIENTCTVVCPHPFSAPDYAMTDISQTIDDKGATPPEELDEKDLEDKYDPSLMSLEMGTWTWVRTLYNNDTELAPKQSNTFTLTFTEESVSATTDCNSMNGSYELNGNQITFGPMVMTKMFCPESQEQEFARMLSEIQSYLFTSKGELVFELKYDTGSSLFRRVDSD